MGQKESGAAGGKLTRSDLSAPTLNLCDWPSAVYAQVSFGRRIYSRGGSKKSGRGGLGGLAARGAALTDYLQTWLDGA